MKDVKTTDKNFINKSDNKLIQSLVSGSLSSAFTTIIYQPLELLKTEIQLRQSKSSENRILGRTTLSAKRLIKLHGITYLWRGTSASLLRSVPGVGLYYSSLNLLQTNFSHNSHIPNDSYQAFYFALAARSLVSFTLAPITFIKVRIESGQFTYASLRSAIGNAYLSNGWVGVLPTILRDSLFSAVYYMFYTQLKINYTAQRSNNHDSTANYLTNFKFGVVSGIIASIVTNPLDVIKTVIQVQDIPPIKRKATAMNTIDFILRKHGISRFFSGLGPRCLRRSLIAASTWTFYEFFKDLLS